MLRAKSRSLVPSSPDSKNNSNSNFGLRLTAGTADDFTITGDAIFTGTIASAIQQGHLRFGGNLDVQGNVAFRPLGGNTVHFEGTTPQSVNVNIDPSLFG